MVSLPWITPRIIPRDMYRKFLFTKYKSISKECDPKNTCYVGSGYKSKKISRHYVLP